MRLSTERLILVSLTPHNMEKVTHILKDPRTRFYFPTADIVPASSDAEIAPAEEELKAEAEEVRTLKIRMHYTGLVRREGTISMCMHLGDQDLTQPAIGVVTIYPEGDRYYLDFAMQSEYRGNRYGSEASRALLQHVATHRPDIDKITVRVEKNNEASMTLLTNSGFVPSRIRSASPEHTNMTLPLCDLREQVQQQTRKAQQQTRKSQGKPNNKQGEAQQQTRISYWKIGAGVLFAAAAVGAAVCLFSKGNTTKPSNR